MATFPRHIRLPRRQIKFFKLFELYGSVTRALTRLSFATTEADIAAHKGSKIPSRTAEAERRPTAAERNFLRQSNLKPLANP